MEDKELEKKEITEEGEVLDETSSIEEGENLIEDSPSEGVNSSEREEKSDKKLKRSDKVFLAITSSLILVMVIHLLLFSFVFFHVSVSGRSMDDTLAHGDVVIVNSRKTPDYGDVVIISGLKENGDWLVKRVIALEGDVVTITDGEVFLNGEKLTETYAKGNTYAPDCRDEGDVHEITYNIGEGEIFFLGDNREDSLDSRYYGTCKVSDVEGVVSEGAIKIKEITTPINNFFIKVKSFFGIKTKN